jgi:cytoskeletal protein CcmA (bactofilin family)
MKPQPKNVTLIAAGAALHGDMILDHGLSNFGMISGTLIATNGLLHIGAGGLVKGNVDGRIVRIDGTVEGNVHARDTLEINGRVKGDVTYSGTIRLGEQAELDGQIRRVARELTIENDVTSVQQLAAVEQAKESVSAQP